MRRPSVSLNGTNSKKWFTETSYAITSRARAQALARGTAGCEFSGLGWYRLKPASTAFAHHTETWAGSSAFVTTLARSFRTASRSTAFFSCAANAATV